MIVRAPNQRGPAPVRAMPVTYPPGPSTGFLGLHFFRRFRHDPLGCLLELASFGDLGYCRMAGVRLYLVNHPDLIQEVLINRRKQVRKVRRQLRTLGSVDGAGLVTSEGELWARQRRLVQPAFHKRRLEHYADIVVGRTKRRVDAWAQEIEVDIAAVMTDLTLEIIAKALFDLDVSGRATQLGRAVRVLSEVLAVEMSTPVPLPDWVPLPSKRRKRRALRMLNNFIIEMIRERRATQEDRGDLLSMLLMAVDDEGDGTGMSDRQARDEAMTLFNAGHDSTAAALSWAWYLIAKHPEVQARVRDEVRGVVGDRAASYHDLPQLTYTEKVVKESMRLYPPTWALFMREALDEMTLGGYRVPRGSWLYASPFATHRDARFFTDPLRFDPERFSVERVSEIPRHAYFPFGVGPHTCIGNHFAMMEATLIVATLLQRHRVTLPPGERPVTAEALIAMRPEGGLRVRVTPSGPGSCRT